MQGCSMIIIALIEQVHSIIAIFQQGPDFVHISFRCGLNKSGQSCLRSKGGSIFFQVLNDLGMLVSVGIIEGRSTATDKIGETKGDETLFRIHLTQSNISVLQ